MDEAKAVTPEQLAADEVYGLRPELERAIMEALEQQRPEEVRALVLPLHYSDTADLIDRLAPDDRRNLLAIIRNEFEPETLTELDEHVRDEVIEQLGFANFANALTELDSDDAVYLIDQLEAEERQRILDALPPERRAIVEEGLAYPEYSAGRLMQRETVAVPLYWTVGETIDFLRVSRSVPEQFYDIFVVDPRHRPLGRIGLARLLRSKRPTRLREIIEAEVYPIGVLTDQEEVAFLFRQHNLVSAPVVDPAGRLVGQITVDDVVDVIDEEAADDMLRLAGVAQTDLYRDIIDTTRARSTWLLVNLGTAVLASMVIGVFQSSIEQVVALAVLMPIVASMGGNAGTQTLTVAVRALAMKELGRSNAWRIIGKECLVGLLNGIIFAVISGIVAWVWFGQPIIGVVIGMAMVVNLVVAGFAGAMLPVALERLGIDPAIASSVFLTTITDVIGFFAFLGLASWIVL